MQRDEFQVRSFPSLLDFSAPHSDGQALRICIATEEIFGPVRNGGIASTYYHLARTLASDGHSVTVLYLKGTKCENKTIGHWIDFYQDLGIRFAPLPAMPFEMICPSPRWQRSMYEFYLWLKNEEPYDVVHTSEWRGGAFYALIAKRLALAFENTIFLVKTSSPWIWNRHYRMLPLGNKAELARMYPERRVVELADIVIGGSAHLLSFMEQKGYRLPSGRTFVQPNIIDLQDLSVEEKRPAYAYGDRVRTGELVFFGRLESRKGLDIFCEALSRIAARGVQPLKVTFMGKKGERLPAHPEMTSIEYIRRQARAWSFPVEIIDSYDQDRAISYLCASPRIAVMPSVIENSTMTVYECLVHRIPFLASAVGGTGELIDEQYHDRVLVDPHPESLSDALFRVLREGGTVAEGAFDYLENLSAWRTFHRFLGASLMQRATRDLVVDIGNGTRDAPTLPPPAEERNPHVEGSSSEGKESARPPSEPRISVCVYHHGDTESVEGLLDSLRFQSVRFHELTIVNDGLGAEATSAIRDYTARHFSFIDCKILEQPHRCIGSSFNAASRQGSADLLVFLNAERHYCKPDLIEVLRRAAKGSPAAAFTFFHSAFEDGESAELSEDRVRVTPLGGDLATGFYEDGVFGGSCLAVRRQAFDAVGGFYEGYHIDGIEQEFQARLLIAGHELEVIPEVLYRERIGVSKSAMNRKSKEYLAIRPYLQNAPAYMENIMLTARMLARRVEKAETRVHIHRAQAAVGRKDWESACTLWAEMRRSFPDHPAGFVRGAAALKRAGRLQEADSLASIAIKRFPRHPGGYIQVAELAMRRRDWEAASALWARLRRSFPENAEGFVRGAAALMKAGRPREAEKIRLLTPLPPSSPEGSSAVQTHLAADVQSSNRLPMSRPPLAASVLTLKRFTTRFGIDRLEASVLLDPAWVAGARKRHGSAAAFVLRRNGRLAARITIDHEAPGGLRVPAELRIPVLGDVLYSVHDAFTDETLASLISPPLRRAQRVAGNVESRQRPEVVGWVVDPDNPERSRKVALHVDGSLLDVVDATAPPGESAPKGEAKACPGFVWPIPETLATRDGTLIEVFDAGTGRPLPGSPVRLHNGQVIATE